MCMSIFVESHCSNYGCIYNAFPLKFPAKYGRGASKIILALFFVSFSVMLKMAVGCKKTCIKSELQISFLAVLVRCGFEPRLNRCGLT